MKIVKLIISTLLLGLSVPAFATKHFVTTPNQAGPALATLIITTNNSKSFSAVADVREYVGVSTTAPCSDLKLYYSNEKEEIEIKPHQSIITSDRFIKEIGPGFTCYRSDEVIAGKAYSTNNLTLVWDAANRAYTSIKPNVITINYDSRVNQ